MLGGPICPPFAGTYQVGRFALFGAVIDAGEPIAVRDVRTTDLMEEELRRLCQQLQILSVLYLPVIKEGRVAGVLCLTQCTPRDWSASQIRLAAETAERLWAAVHRARSEAALQASEARLRESDRCKDEFLAMLGHELRNPLAGIRGSIEMVKLQRVASCWSKTIG